MNHAFLPLISNGIVGFPFRVRTLQRTFSLRATCGYYRKTELATIIRTHFAYNVSKAQKANARVLGMIGTKDLAGFPGEDFLHWKDAEILFRQLGCDMDLEPFSKRQQCEKEFIMMFKVMFHERWNIWNVSHLAAVKLPSDVFPVAKAKVVIEVLGERDVEGVYVDAPTFLELCNSLDAYTWFDKGIDTSSGSLPPQHGFLLADRKLLFGTASFDLSSLIVTYCSREYTETEALRLCKEYGLAALEAGIMRLKKPPRLIDSVLGLWNSNDCSQSQAQSIPESLRSVSSLSTARNKINSRTTGPSMHLAEPSINGVSEDAEPNNYVQDWIEKQRSRKRKRCLHPADIRPTQWIVNGKLQSPSVKSCQLTQTATTLRSYTGSALSSSYTGNDVVVPTAEHPHSLHQPENTNNLSERAEALLNRANAAREFTPTSEFPSYSPTVADTERDE